VDCPLACRRCGGRHTGACISRRTALTEAAIALEQGEPNQVEEEEEEGQLEEGGKHGAVVQNRTTASTALDSMSEGKANRTRE